MSVSSPNIFRAAAIERVSSPEQFDQLITVRRPDRLGQPPSPSCSRFLVSRTGACSAAFPRACKAKESWSASPAPVVDVVSAAAGRVERVEIAVGDKVTEGQIVARISRPEAEQRLRSAEEMLQERAWERDELFARSSASSTSRRLICRLVKITSASPALWRF
jgi:HlyD family secretion protein